MVSTAAFGTWPTVGQINVIARIVAAAVLAVSATDTLVARFPVVFPGQKGRAATPGNSLAWDRESSTVGVLDKHGIAKKLCLPLAALGITAMSSSTLMVELGTRAVFGSAVVPELLSPSVLRGLKIASVVSTAWFGGVAIWIVVASKWAAAPAPTRGRVRTSALFGWALVAFTMYHRIARTHRA